ncbi:hypothetical protein [Rhizobium mongolense]|uniref:Uncharacterized protein n=2 Tax=Rhizobium mongolense TaxID=57676 RepID=A0ABR6IRS5_9HYPH|nr:hypothetical protein [Rhizobium mongolense]MBB4230610.1 hypothetical protein [Rhizobium mongolense]TVZ65325.1 hypothetical protein BCL32_5620 [Rhizobium mongolense USDA 1844]
MTQDLNRIEIDLQRMSEGWTMPSGNSIQMPPIHQCRIWTLKHI